MDRCSEIHACVRLPKMRFGANRKHASKSAIHRDMGSCQSNYDMVFLPEAGKKPRRSPDRAARHNGPDRIASATIRCALGFFKFWRA
jgi:hypothetical protein